MKIAAVLVAVGLLAGCDGTKKDTVPSPHVLRGAVDKADGSVVALKMGAWWCTGTVVAPKYVLTAAHCFEHGAQAVSVATNASTIYGRNAWRPAKTVHFAPGWMPGRYEYDIALVEMNEPLDVAPIPINYDGKAARAIDSVRMIGFGPTATGNGTQGTKRVANVPVHPTAAFFETVPGNGSCYGDSGGPSLALIDGVEKIVAVTSHGVDDRCEDGGRVVRTDVHHAFLAEHLGDVPRGGSGAKTPSEEQPQPPHPPLPLLPAVVDGLAPVTCSGSQHVTIRGRTIVASSGAAVRASGSCHITLQGVRIEGPIGIEASGSSHVTMMGGSIDASSQAVRSTGSAQVTLTGTELLGSTATGDVTRVGTTEAAPNNPRSLGPYRLELPASVTLSFELTVPEDALGGAFASSSEGGTEPDLSQARAPVLRSAVVKRTSF